MDGIRELLSSIYSDSGRSARLIGLHYAGEGTPGYARRRRGNGFSYADEYGHAVPIAEKQRIDQLAIPPAWYDVWIAASPTSHILATGIDEQGRKQYIYHSKWSKFRGLVKFYRMIMFGESLPAIRATTAQSLARTSLERGKVLAVMLWLLDNTYIRIGNEAYYEENSSVGLTTLTPQNVIVSGTVTTLSFTSKSGKQREIAFDDARIAHLITQLKKREVGRLFTYRHRGRFVPFEPKDINAHLREISGKTVSAKDFRTWGGTLLAFDHLATAVERSQPLTERERTKEVITAVDTAAAVLGNTRAVAKSSYVHPHVLQVFGNKDFNAYLVRVKHRKQIAGLDTQESCLIYFLRELLNGEFDLLRPVARTGSTAQPAGRNVQPQSVR